MLITGVRLSKIAAETNVGVTTIIDYLHDNGYEGLYTVNSKVPEDVADMLIKAFSKDKEEKKKLENLQSMYVGIQNRETISIDTPYIAGDKSPRVLRGIGFEREERIIKHVEIKKKVYVIDTNVFVNDPDIISKIDSHHKIVMAAKVIDELDKLKVKLDEQGACKVQKAIRNINNTDRAIIFELSDMTLLPPDFDSKSPDNMILSVAMKYKDDNPILLTSDNGLQVKAKILRVETIGLKNFLKIASRC